MDKIIIICFIGIIILSSILVVDMMAGPVAIKDVYITTSQTPGEYYINVLLENSAKGDVVRADIKSVGGKSVYYIYHAPPEDVVKYQIALKPGIYDVKASCGNSQFTETFIIN